MRILWMALAVVVCGGCGKPPAGPPAGKVKIVTSILPVYCIAANVAGDLATVENILPANAEPHHYQFSPRDMNRLKEAQLIFINGLGLEGWLEKAIDIASEDRGRKLVKAADGLHEELISEADSRKIGAAAGGQPEARSKSPERGHDHDASQEHNHAHDHDHDHAHEGVNPHIWLDPRLAAHAVTNILNALKRVDPAQASQYEVNAQRYIERLERLDKELEAGLAGLSGQAFVTVHNAFPYLARRYNLRLVGVIEAWAGLEPSPRYLSALLDEMRTTQARVIFAESGTPLKLVEELAKDLGAKVGELESLERGPVGLMAYEDGMRRNMEALKRALQ